jgi:hypothetical protein
MQQITTYKPSQPLPRNKTAAKKKSAKLAMSKATNTAKEPLHYLPFKQTAPKQARN